MKKTGRLIFVGGGHFEAAAFACLRADYDLTLTLLDGESGAHANMLRSTALRRMGRVDEALEAAGSATATVHGEERVLALTVLTHAYIDLGDAKSAAATVARIHHNGKRSDEMRAQVGYARMIVAHFCGDHAGVEKHLIEAGRSNPNARARATHLFASMCVATGRAEEASQMFAHALTLLHDAGQHADMALYAATLCDLAALVAEMPFPVDLAEIRADLQRLPQTWYLAEQCFGAYRNLGMRLTLDGGVSASLGLVLLRRGAEYATTNAQRVSVLLDAAYVAYALDEPYSGGASLAEANELAESIDWGAESGDERNALIVAAELYASRDHARAQKYLDLHRSLPPPAAALSIAQNRRIQASLAYAEGIVARYAGNSALAIGRLEHACELFASMKYNWRAALAAFEMYEITKTEEHRVRASDLIHAYPQSWIAARIGDASIFQDPRYRALTPTERKVFELLSQACGRPEIAVRLSISKSTLNKHIGNIFRAWRVSSQRELLAAVRATSRRTSQPHGGWIF